MKKVIEAFQPSGGKHCITNALKQLFCYYRHPLSEEMLFGLGEGLDFVYINLANAPMVSGRTKILEFEDTLSQHLGLSIKIKSSKDYDRIFNITKNRIDADQPVFVYVDMAYLPYMSLNESSHFGGHAIVIFGYDDEQECFYVSDRDNSDYPVRTPNGEIAKDFHLVSYAQMQKARESAARPFPANNKYGAEINFQGFCGVTKESIRSAIAGVCNKMLNPVAKLKGIYGIEKFSKEIKRWFSFDQDKLKIAGVTNYFQISKDGGTGGGIFRKMYGDFLIEASDIIGNKKTWDIGQQFISMSNNWDKLADEMWELSLDGQASKLPKMATEIKKLYETECVLLLELNSVYN